MLKNRGRLVFIINLSSETGIAIHISKFISIAAFQVTMFPPIPALFIYIYIYIYIYINAVSYIYIYIYIYMKNTQPIVIFYLL